MSGDTIRITHCRVEISDNVLIPRVYLKQGDDEDEFDITYQLFKDFDGKQIEILIREA